MRKFECGNLLLDGEAAAGARQGEAAVGARQALGANLTKGPVFSSVRRI